MEHGVAPDRDGAGEFLPRLGQCIIIQFLYMVLRAERGRGGVPLAERPEPAAGGERRNDEHHDEIGDFFLLHGAKPPFLPFGLSIFVS